MPALASSFRRLREAGFSQRFYQLLLRSDPRIPVLFAKTDFARQRDLLEHGVLMLLDFRRGGALGRLAIERLGRLHDSDRVRVPADLYPIWVRCFLAAAAELDPDWTDELAQTWHTALDEFIAKMRHSS